MSKTLSMAGSAQTYFFKNPAKLQIALPTLHFDIWSLITGH